MTGWGGGAEPSTEQEREDSNAASLPELLALSGARSLLSADAGGGYHDGGGGGRGESGLCQARGWDELSANRRRRSCLGCRASSLVGSSETRDYGSRRALRLRFDIPACHGRHGRPV